MWVESTSRWRGREARHRPAKPFTRVRIPSPPPHSRSRPECKTRAIGAAVARFPDTEEVTGSIPVSPTTRRPPHGAAFGVPPPTLAYVRVEPEVPRTDVRTSG